MIEVNTLLDSLYYDAKANGVALIKDCKLKGNYGCCGNHAPKIEKYKITYQADLATFYLWGKLLVAVDLTTKTAAYNPTLTLSNYDKKLIQWFLIKTKADGNS